MAKKTLMVDIESHNAEKRFDMAPRDFMRLAQYAWGRDGEVQITTDYDEFVAVLREADLVVGHNLIDFDLPAVLGADETMEMCMAGRVLDTYQWARLVNPAPYSYTNRAGHTFYDAGDPRNARKWLSLDNQAFQLGVPGKIADLKDLAKKHNPKGTLVKNMDFGAIPLDDPEFLAYAEQDVVTLQQVAVKLIDKTNREQHSWQYLWREMAIAGVTQKITANGFRVDKEAAEERIAELEAERDEIMDWLVKEYDFPTEGKSPWASNAGKEVIFKALADYGITEKSRPDWTLTNTGNLSLGGEVLLELTEGTEAEKFGRGLATLKGQRSLAALALESMHDDGYAHPDIAPLQRSFRWSVTKPGLTVWTARGPGAIEKRYFIPSEGHKLVSIDYSNADARVVAAYSGDPVYGKRFVEDENGKLPDGHELNGRAGFGDERYESNPEKYRQDAKILGHGWNYGGRAKTLAKQTGVDLESAVEFVNNMDRTYQWLVSWQNDTRAEGKSGWVLNDWGGRMKIDEGREFTQSPAMMGQNGTREILADGLLKMYRKDKRLLNWVVAIIHDEIIADIPESELDWAVPAMVDCLETVFHPKKYNYSAPIEFTVSAGEPADNWFQASH